MTHPIDALKAIFTAGLKSVDPHAMILKKVALQKEVLTISHENRRDTLDLSCFRSIYVIGAGKASARMALALEEILGERITGGVVSVKYGHTEPLSHIRLIEAGHPVPDAMSRKAAEEIFSLCRQLTEKDLVISLISGGGSALLSLPVKEIEDEDKRETTEQLLACGADICEINCIRKHLSAIKGGRLIAAAHPATTINLILSDVIGDRLDAIASGLTSHDDTQFSDAIEILEKYELKNKIPPKVVSYLEKGCKDPRLETPKQGSDIFSKNQNIVIGSNIIAVKNAAEKAQELGFNTVALSSQILGEARIAAANYAGIGMDIVRDELLVKRPACVIAGGETTVTLKGTGKGGRNQEMALAFLKCIAENRDAMENIHFLSAATDGNDGPTDAAGGFASLELLNHAKDPITEIDKSLKNNDAYHFLKRNSMLYVTGPTNTNVCDLQLMIVS
ncbi:MAG: glycerate kinase [Desulfobacterales bacterium]|nr:glycerate kinase [Desulfobacterales bacterium]